MSVPISTLAARLGARARAAVPEGARVLVTRARYTGNAVHCPLCDGSFRQFRPYGNPPKPNRACPSCGSLRRHRLLWLYLTRELGVDHRTLRVLHVAPERALGAPLAAAKNLTYITADLDHPGAAVRTDLTRAAFPDGSFDLIICSHVLEHIPDDHSAMTELRRMLAPDGLAVVLVPVRRRSAHTDEDPSVTTREDRLGRYGHPEHVRYYGRDVKDRLVAAGLTVREVDYAGQLSPGEVESLAADGGEPLYVCRR